MPFLKGIGSKKMSWLPLKCHDYPPYVSSKCHDYPQNVTITLKNVTITPKMSQLPQKCHNSLKMSRLP